MKTLTKIEKIVNKYSKLTHNNNNFDIGGGLSNCGKKASNRHEEALSDNGKITFGKASQMFKKASELSILEVKEVINYAVPNMEWHHAGFLPKSYGGGMKKTYFLNSAEIVDIAENWDNYLEKLEISKTEKRKEFEKERSIEEKKQDFLNKNAKRIERTTNIPEFFYETNREMNGKYGWFSCYGKSYNMTEYYTGWSFKNEKTYRKFFQIN